MVVYGNVGRDLVAREIPSVPRRVLWTNPEHWEQSYCKALT